YNIDQKYLLDIRDLLNPSCRLLSSRGEIGCEHHFREDISAEIILRVYALSEQDLVADDEQVRLALSQDFRGNRTQEHAFYQALSLRTHTDERYILFCRHAGYDLPNAAAIHKIHSRSRLWPLQIY